MSKSALFSTNLLKLYLQNIALALVGDAAGLQPSAAPGFLYVSLHTADPGEGGDQTTSEATYSGYARIPVVRSASGWAVATVGTKGVGSNVAAVKGAAAASGSQTLSHFRVGTSATGAGSVGYTGVIGTVETPAPITITTGIAPEFAPGTLIVSED